MTAFTGQTTFNGFANNLMKSRLSTGRLCESAIRPDGSPDPGAFLGPNLRDLVEPEAIPTIRHPSRDA